MDTKIIKSNVVAKDLCLNPLLIKLGVTEKDVESTIQFFADESKYFEHYDTMCITKDNTILNHSEVWEAAMLNDPDELLNVDVIDIDENDLIRFINCKSLFIKRNYKARWALMKELRKYLETNAKGIAWDKALKAGDILETIAKITAYSRSLIQQLQVVGKHYDDNPNESWDEIGYGSNQISLKEKYKKIKKMLGDKGGKVGDDLFLDDKNKKQQIHKQEALQIKLDKQKDNQTKLKGKERLYFKLNWKVEGIEFKDDAPCSAKKKFDTSSNIQTYQCVDDAGRLLAEIKVDIDKAFITEKNKPL